MTTQQANEKPASEMLKPSSMKAAGRGSVPHLVSLNERPRPLEADTPLRSEAAALAGVVPFNKPTQPHSTVLGRHVETAPKRWSLLSAGVKRLLDVVGALTAAPSSV